MVKQHGNKHTITSLSLSLSSPKNCSKIQRLLPMRSEPCPLALPRHSDFKTTSPLGGPSTSTFSREPVTGLFSVYTMVVRHGGAVTATKHENFQRARKLRLPSHPAVQRWRCSNAHNSQTKQVMTQELRDAS